MKKCPYCAEEIQDEAIKCRFCGEMLNKPESAPSSPTATETPEEIIKETKPTLVSYTGFFILGALLLAFYGLGLIFIIGALIHRDTIKYTITNKRIRIKKGVVANHVDEIDLAHIRNVSLRQNFDAKILGYGDVLVGTAGTAGYEIIIEKIEKLQETMTLIKDLQVRAKR